MHACMFFEPYVRIIVFLLFDASHVFVEIIIYVFVAIARIKSLQKELVIVLPRKLL